MPLQWRLTTLTVQWRQWNLPKVCCIFRVFVCLSSFSFPLSLLLRWAVTLQRKVIINMRRCRLQTDNLMTIARRNRRPHDLIQRLTAWRSRSCIVIGQKSNIGVVRKVIGLTGCFKLWINRYVYPSLINVVFMLADIIWPSFRWSFCFLSQLCFYWRVPLPKVGLRGNVVLRTACKSN